MGHHSNSPVIYTGEFFLSNKMTQRPTTFLSDNPTHARFEYSNKLTRLGLFTPPGDIVNSSVVMVDFLQHTLPNAKLFVVKPHFILTDLDDLLPVGIT